MENQLEMHAIFQGRVQGVGFRAAVKKFALDLGLTGTVKNIGDEKVEIVAQGKKESLNRLIEQLKKAFNHGSLHDVQIEFQKAAQSFDTFSILR